MTYRKRGVAPSPEFSSRASSVMNTSNFKRYHHHHHKSDQHNKYDDDDDDDVDDDEEEEEEDNGDYTEASRSQSPYEVDDEEPAITDDDYNYAQSESVDNAPVIISDKSSSPLPKFQHVRDNILFEKSPLNSPKFSIPITQTTSSYINVAPLPIFRGTSDECPMTHLSRFSKVCCANNASSIDMMMKIFPVTLENEAYLWYDLNIEPYSLTWEEIKSSFMDAYHRNDHVDQFRQEVMMMNQNSEESVRSFFLRLQLMLKKWPDHGLSDGTLKGIFIDGLREDFQDWIIPQGPDSLEEALRLAFDLEQVQCIRTSRRQKKCGFCDGPHDERECEVRERMRELWFKSKEKQLDGVYLKKSTESSSGDGVAKKAVVRPVSVGTSSVVGKKDVGDDEKEEVEEKVLVGKQKSQCQCAKHQCWKKKLERNNIVL